MTHDQELQRLLVLLDRTNTGRRLEYAQNIRRLLRLRGLCVVVRSIWLQTHTEQDQVLRQARTNRWWSWNHLLPMFRKLVPRVQELWLEREIHTESFPDTNNQQQQEIRFRFETWSLNSSYEGMTRLEPGEAEGPMVYDFFSHRLTTQDWELQPMTAFLGLVLAMRNADRRRLRQK